MVWTDVTEEKQEGLLKVLMTRSDPVTGTSVTDDAADGADGDRDREALHGAQVVREAVAGDAARLDTQEPPHHEVSGARRPAPVQEGQASD
jgi:hypothetical protein